jgi:DNA-binding transcriptional LysR family regulator
MTAKTLSIQADSLRNIIYFVTVAKMGSFTVAANEIGISKSALGKSIAKLEHHLGTLLFHRTTRKLSLTTEGEAYLASCKQALDTLQNAESALQLKYGQPTGRVRVDMPVSFGRQVMMPILLDMAEHYPDLQLITTFNDKLIDPVEEGVDLAIRFGELKDSSEIVAKKLNDQQLIFCASTRYLARYGRPESLSELKNHRCIMAWRGGKPLGWLTQTELGDNVRINPEPFHQVSDGDAMVDACLAGAGIIQFPASLLHQWIDSGELIEILSHDRPAPTELNVIWPKTKYLTLSVRFIIDELCRLASEGAFR